jgi:flagellar basal-body rod modification protein FlgD
MDIARTAATTANARTPDKASASALSSDFDTFLRMMTTQLQNQDPLKPIDSADYAVQLATFSGVEQQAKTNQLLESMKTEFGLMGMAQMANWVGREARSTAPVWADGDPVTLSPVPAPDADRTVLAVYDKDGTLVARKDVPVSRNALQWQPEDATGAALPPGTYSFKLESYKGEEKISTTPVEAYGRITEVRGGNGGTTLVLEGGAEVPASFVTALRG